MKRRRFICIAALVALVSTTLLWPAPAVAHSDTPFTATGQAWIVGFTMEPLPDGRVRIQEQVDGIILSSTWEALLGASFSMTFQSIATFFPDFTFTERIKKATFFMTTADEAGTLEGKLKGNIEGTWMPGPPEFPIIPVGANGEGKWKAKQGSGSLEDAKARGTWTSSFPPGAMVGDFTFTGTYKTKEPPQTAELWADKYRWADPAPGYEWVTPTLFRSWLDVRFENDGPGDAYNVTATLTCWPANVTVVDGDVSLGDIPEGDKAWSQDSFTLEVDMTNLQDPDKGIVWRVEYDDSAGNHHVIQDVPKFKGEPINCP